MKEQGLKLPCGRKRKDAAPALKFTGKMELDRKARVAVIRRQNNAEYRAALQASVAAKADQARRQAEQERAVRDAQDAAITVIGSGGHERRKPARSPRPSRPN
jgi:hypothetical protein